MSLLAWCFLLLLVQASYLTDFFVLYILRKRYLYHTHKYQRVKEDKNDDFILIRDDASIDPESDDSGSLSR